MLFLVDMAGMYMSVMMVRDLMVTVYVVSCRHGWHVHVSNDGQGFSSPLMVTVYDATCLVCKSLASCKIRVSVYRHTLCLHSQILGIGSIYNLNAYIKLRENTGLRD